MKMFYDPAFWWSVGIGTGMILLFSWYIFRIGRPRKRRTEVIHQVRCKNEADEIRAMVSKCITPGDLDRLLNTVNQFYIDNYDIVGIPYCLKLVSVLERAIADQRKKINEPL